MLLISNDFAQIRILFFSAVAVKIPTENNFFPKVFLFILTLGTNFIHQSSKSLRSQKTVEIKVSLNFIACWWNDPDTYLHINYITDHERPKTNRSGTLTESIGSNRIQIHYPARKTTLLSQEMFYGTDLNLLMNGKDVPVEESAVAEFFPAFLAGQLLLPVPHEVDVERFAAAHFSLLADEAHVLAFLK